MKLLEREHTKAAIASVLDRALRGEASVLFVVGEPGLGKTTLLADCCAGASGFSVARAGCSELEQSIPFGLLDRLLGGFGVPGAAVGSYIGGSREARLRRYASTLEWMRSAAPSPLLLAVDDLHWADLDSVELLSLLCRRLEGLKVALVATTRPWPAVALDQARSLAHDRFATIERLRPLSGTASASLLEQRLGAELPEGFVRSASQACAGNPLLLAEVAEARLRGEDLVSGSVNALRERVFLPRFAGVGAPALRWARAASVLGSRFRPDVVRRLSGQSGAEAAKATEALCAAGLLRGLPGGSVEFVHPLLRQALYDDLAAPTRQGLHASALMALLEDGAAPAEAAPHALGAQLKGDPKAVAVLAAAGSQALAAGAVATAAEDFKAALDLAGGLAEPSLRLELANTCLLTGEVELAADALEQLLRQQDLADADRVTGVRLQGRVLLASARYPEAKRCLEQASELAARSDPDMAAEILLDGAFLGYMFEGPREACGTVRRAVRMAKGSGTASDALRLAAHHAEGNLACVSGDPSRLDEMAVAARANLDVPQRRSAWSWDISFGYANLAKFSERFDDARHIFSSLIDEAKQQGATLTYQTLAINYADTLWRLGELEPARGLLLEAAEVAELVPTLGPFAWVGLGHIFYEQGAHQESARCVARAESSMDRIGEPPYLRLWLCLLSCRQLLNAGRVLEAVQVSERAAEVSQRSGMLEPCVVPWHGAAIEAQLAAGRLQRANELIASLADVCQPLSCHAPRAVAARGRAAIAWRMGEVQLAQACFDEALEHSAAVPMPLAEAEVLIEYGQLLRHTGQPGRAREVLHRALAVLEPTGAGRLQAIAHEQLASAGGRRRRTRSVDQLTAKERQVAKLAVQGLTNAQIAKAVFVSAKTVDHHLSRAYNKLRVGSRRELMLAWRDREAAEGLGHIELGHVEAPGAAPRPAGPNDGRRVNPTVLDLTVAGGVATQK